MKKRVMKSASGKTIPYTSRRDVEEIFIRNVNIGQLEHTLTVINRGGFLHLDFSQGDSKVPSYDFDYLMLLDEKGIMFQRRKENNNGFYQERLSIAKISGRKKKKGDIVWANTSNPFYSEDYEPFYVPFGPAKAD
jgi:hypothetical protein